MKNKLLVLISLFFLSNCTPVLKLYYAYRQPKAEDSKSLVKYYTKKGIDTSNMLVFSDSIKYKARLKDVNSLPEIRIYNKEGLAVYYKDTSKLCNGPAYEFTESICMVSDLKFNALKNLESETNGLMTLNNVPFHLTPDSGYDYYVFIYCARFLGRLNKDHVKIWGHNLENAKGCKVKYYLVDMDWQKCWDQ